MKHRKFSHIFLHQKIFFSVVWILYSNRKLSVKLGENHSIQTKSFLHPLFVCYFSIISKSSSRLTAIDAQKSCILPHSCTHKRTHSQTNIFPKDYTGKNESHHLHMMMRNRKRDGRLLTSRQFFQCQLLFGKSWSF